MKNLEMKNFIGRKYGSLTDEEKNFIETKITGTVVQENGMELKRRNGDCIIDFEDNISIDNGLTWVEPEEAISKMRWEVIAHYMEDEAREQVHHELAPCTDLEFLKRYLEVAENDLVIG